MIKKISIVLLLILSSCSGMNNPVIAKISSNNGYGQGVTVRPDGLILTAAHVLPVDDIIYISVNNKNYTAKVVYRDNEKDFALVKVDDKNMPFAKVTKNYQEGAEINTVGFKGVIMSADSKSIYLDMAIRRGDSGAAVFNSDGEVIGVIIQSLYYLPFLGSPNIGVALTSDNFINLINTIQ